MCLLCDLGSRDPAFHAFDSFFQTSENAYEGASLARPSLTTAQAAGHIAETAWSSPGTPITYAFRSTSTEAGFQRFTSTQIQGAELALQAWADVANLRFQRVGGGTEGEGAYSNDATMLFNRFASTTSYAYAYLPGSRAVASLSGDVFLNAAAASLNAMNFGGYGFMTMMHEVGHAIGLSHPGAYDAADNTPITFADNAEYGQDSRQYTVMSYFDAEETGANHSDRYAATPLLHDIAAIQSLYGANTTTRTGDTVYGFNANVDRAAYQITSDQQRPIFSIWDAGGTDTLDLSGYGQTQTVNLAANSFSDVGGLTGNVSIASGALVENAVGGSGVDRLLGNEANNLLRGRGGNDVLTGLSGGDRIEGDEGNDELDGGDGDDSLAGGSGDDLLRGGAGTDTLSGSSGRDTFVLAPGSFDTVVDFAAADDRVLIAGLEGATDGAQVFWWASSRVLAWDPDGEGSRGRADLGRLEIDGNLSGSNITGPQRFAFVTETTPVVTPPPTPTVTPAVTPTVTPVVAPVVTPTPTPTNETRAGFERRGTEAPDQLVGGPDNDRLYGQGGDDTLRGEAGNDEIHGEEGGDRLEGGDGDDRLGGGHGNDRLFGGNGGDTLNGGTGNDELHGEEGDDELSGEDGNDRLGAGHGNDRASGHGGEDEIFGGTGNDELHGGDGHDLLSGEDGHDRLHGNDGEDRLFGGSGEDELQGGGGNDRLEGGSGHDVLAGGNDRDELRAGDGDDRLFGSEGEDDLFGEHGRDMLWGDGGEDRLFGGDGEDTLEGGDGRDRLEGGEGEDRLLGGRGDDVLIGGGSRDTFFFARDLNRDILTDFHREDIIEFRDGLFGNAQAVLARAFQSGSDTIIEDGGTQFVLQNVLRSSLEADDFRFA